MMERIFRFFESYFHVVGLNDLIDIAIITILIYTLIHFFKETRAVQLMRGILMLFIILQVSDWLNLHVLNFVLSKTLEVGLIALIIIFQPELRNALERVGTSTFRSILPITSPEQDMEALEQDIVEIADACQALSATNTGALIAIEQKSRLNDIVASGTKMDALITKEMIGNIFFPNTPLHDGAVVISKNKIAAAGCLLPLTQNAALPSELGTRHRAAIGLSEQSDAIVIVVSEETGKISVARKGMLTRNYDRDSLNNLLRKLLIVMPQQQEKRKKFFSKKENDQ